MNRKKSEFNTEELLGVIINGIQEVKGNQITVLDLRQIPQAVSDYFVVCHGSSTTQVEAIGNSVIRETLKVYNESPWRKEGTTNAEWVLLDYFNIVLHVFHEEARLKYGLEELWADAEIKKVEYRA